MDPQRENLVKLVFGSLSVCIFLIVACVSVCICFPADSDSNVVPLVSKTSRDVEDSSSEEKSVQAQDASNKDFSAMVVDNDKFDEEEFGIVADFTEETPTLPKKKTSVIISILKGFHPAFTCG